MVRRTSSRKSQDEQAFPIRLRIDNILSGTGSLRWTDAEVWLNENVGRGEWAKHNDGHRMAFFFRTGEAVHRFCGAFPDLELADYTPQVEHLRQARRYAAPTATAAE